MQLTLALSTIVSVIFLSAADVCAARNLPHIPRQFTTDLVITSHQVDAAREYPPRERHIKIVYDSNTPAVYAKIVKGYEAGRTYVRRYDLKKEYMVRGGQYAECRRSYLGEKLPEVVFPRHIHYEGKDSEDMNMDHWTIKNQDSIIHIYMKNKLPFKAVEESVNGGMSTLLSSYEFRNVIVGPPKNKNIFDIPNGYKHDECDNLVGGFPYIHAFLHFLRF